MAVLEELDEEESYLAAILADESGLDAGEMLWVDDNNDDGCWRAWPYQWTWWRCTDRLQIDRCSRSVGKSVSLQLRAFIFPFVHPGMEMVITAPELVHLKPVTQAVETRLMNVRLSREMLDKRNRGTGFTHQPFGVQFSNGARILGRIPQRDGRGCKGLHPLWLELDEAADYPEPGFIELNETLRYGQEGAVWRCHGVTTGVRNKFYEYTQPDSGWTVHNYIAMHRPDWTDEERQQKILLYGSRNSPDYRRNILGEHGDAANPIFVLSRLLSCFIDTTQVKVWDYERQREYLKSIVDIQVGDTVVNAAGLGKIVAKISSERDKLLKVMIGSEEFYCTPEHPFLTEGGWVAADKLKVGDAIVNVENMRDVWESVLGQREAEILQTRVYPSPQEDSSLQTLRGTRKEGVDVLLGGLSSASSCSSSGSNLRYVRESTHCAAGGVLLPEVRGEVEKNQIEISSLSVLREGTSGQRSVKVLFPRLWIRGSEGSSDRESVMRRVRRCIRNEQREQVLFEIMCREIKWEKRSGQAQEANPHDLRRLWDRVLPSIQEGAVSLTSLRQPEGSGCQEVVSEEMPVLSGVISARSKLSQILLRSLLAGRTKIRRSRTLGFSTGSVFSLEGPGGAWRSLVSTALHNTRRFGRRRTLVPIRFSGPRIENSNRSRWDRPPTDRPCSARSDSRRLANLPRVESIEILERGSEEFDRLSGGKDTVTVWDLTVSGHPSFAIGEQGILVHNCVDQAESSDYNQNEYVKISITEEKLKQYGLPIEEFIKVPATHRKYDFVWIGADIGFTNHPTEILVFAEEQRQRQTGGPTNRQAPSEMVMKLVSRWHLERISAPDQRKAFHKLCEIYRPKAISMDKTGNGLPLYQDLLVEHPATARIIKGYNFSSKIPVDWEDAENIQDTLIMKNVLEHASDKAREYVDAGWMKLPWDLELIKELQGQTFTVVKSTLNPYGKKEFSKGSYHALDALKMAVLGKVLDPIEKILGMKEEEFDGILDKFYS